MKDYLAFGGVFRSQLELPELEPVAGGQTPDCALEIAEGCCPPLEMVQLGEEQVEADVQVKLFRAPDRLRLVFDDTGTFDVLEEGTRIVWYPPVGEVDLTAVRKDVLGRVMAVALHQRGFVTLHGSAVEIEGSAIAFVAPKFHGKSTTAAALLDAGAALLSDDIVAIVADPAPAVVPAVPSVQLWGDAAQHVGLSARRLSNPQSRKLQVAYESFRGSVPLEAVYVLCPSTSADEGVRRQRVGPVAAPLTLIGQGKIAGLLGTEGGAESLPRICTVASQVAVYRLTVPRDLGRLPELTERLFGWHGAPTALEAS